MKRMDLLEALGNLDEKYTNEADARAKATLKREVSPIEMLTGTAEEPQSRGSRRPAWLRAMTGVAAAAVFALTVGTVGKVILNAGRTPGMTPGNSVASTGTVKTDVRNIFGGEGALHMLLQQERGGGIFEDNGRIYMVGSKQNIQISKETGEISDFLLTYGEGVLFTDGRDICILHSDKVIYRVKDDGEEEKLLDLKELENEYGIRFDTEQDVFRRVGGNRWFLSCGVQMTADQSYGRIVCWIDITEPGTIGHATFFGGSDAEAVKSNPFRYETSVTLTETDEPNLYLFTESAPSDGMVIENVALFRSTESGSLTDFMHDAAKVSYFDGAYYSVEYFDEFKNDYVHSRIVRRPIDNPTADGEVVWNDCGLRSFAIRNGRIYALDYTQNADGEMISVNPDGTDRKVLASGIGPFLYDARFTEKGGEFGGQYAFMTETHLVFCNPENGSTKEFVISRSTDTTDQKPDETEQQTTKTTPVNYNPDYKLYSALYNDTENLFANESEFRKEIDYSGDKLPLSGTAFAEIISVTQEGCLLNVYMPKQNDRESVRTTGEFMLVQYASTIGEILVPSPVMKPAEDRPAAEKPQITITKQEQLLPVNWTESIGKLQEGCYALAVQVVDAEGKYDWFTVNIPVLCGEEQTVKATLIGEDADKFYLTVKKDALTDDGREVAFVDQMRIPAPEGNIMYGPLTPDLKNADLRIPYEYHVQVESIPSAVVQFYYPDLVDHVAEDEILITVSGKNANGSDSSAKGMQMLQAQVFFDDGTAKNEGMTARLLKQYYDNLKGDKCSLESKYINIMFEAK